MSTENPTVALVGLDKGTLNFVQIGKSWDGQGPAPFTTAQVQDLATVLGNQNFVEAFQTGRTLTNALPLIRNEVTWLETELEDQKADSIQHQTEIARLTRSLDLALDAASTGSSGGSRSQVITAPYRSSGDRKTYRTFKAQLQTKLAGDTRKLL